MKNSTLLFFMLFLVGLTACEKDYFKAAPADLNQPVSFSKDIAPIFTGNCAIASCHVSKGQIPFLTASTAIEQLLGMADVDTTIAPEKSVLYMRITATSKPMPPSGKLSSDKINKILAWIKQGAKNN